MFICKYFPILKFKIILTGFKNRVRLLTVYSVNLNCLLTLLFFRRDPLVTFNGKTVLIVDDEPSVAQLLSILLSSHGYATKTAHTGKQALEMVLSGFDLIL